MNPGLRRYLLATIAAGGAVAVAPLVMGPPAVDVKLATQVVLLVGLGGLAERYTLHLTHKTAINTATVLYLAMVFTLHPHLAPLVALLAALAGQASRRREDPIEVAFNAAHAALSVGTAALVFDLLATMPWGGPGIADVGGIGTIALTLVAYQGVGTLIVAVAAALQLGTSVRRTWVGTLTEGMAIEMVLGAMAVVATILLRDAPVLLPVLALPLFVLHRALQELVRLRIDTHAALAELVEVVELRDPYTAGHSRRVAELAHRIAIEMGLTYEVADLIESAGRVHDLGKVAVDPVVLMKPSALTDAEFAEMQRHPAISGQVVAHFAAYGDGWRVVRHHHERFDGKGYPDGIAGEEIPLGARILAVADTFDALTTARPYREARGTEFALDILRKGMGSQWDPRPVEALIAVLAEARPAPVAEPVEERSTPPMGMATAA